jgi:RNA polymerase sigma-70 factor (ECF subfamily)
VVVPDVAATDDTLAACAATGDDAAFEALVARYQARVFRLACRLTSETDAADVVQDTFLQVYQHLASFRGDAQFSTWLYRIATNVCLMLRRSRARRPTEPLDVYLPRFDAHGVHAATPDQLQIATRVEERLDRERLAAAAKTALDRLPEMYRTAFVLRDLEELSTADVAQVLGVAAATVRQRVHRARLMLRGYLNALGEERSCAR